jgi:hypothetical protein
MCAGTAQCQFTTRVKPSNTPADNLHHLSFLDNNNNPNNLIYSILATHTTIVSIRTRLTRNRKAWASWKKKDHDNNAIVQSKEVGLD